MSSQGTSEFKVIIKADAFIRMMTHVLRFGNEALDESIEVMGICVGNIDETRKIINLFKLLFIRFDVLA